MAILPVAVMAALSAAAGNFAPVPADSWGEDTQSFRITYENDSLFSRDQDYSHGTRLAYNNWSDPRGAEIDFGWGVSLTQNIYTPVRHTRHNNWNEHPYAGYLGLGGAFMCRCTDEDNPMGTILEVQIGMTGEPSLAHGVQHAVHALGCMDQWKGWRDQVPSEATLQVSQLTAFRFNPLCADFGYWEMDAQWSVRYDLGTVLVAAGPGVSFRFGHNLPQFIPVYGNRAAVYGTGLVNKGGSGVYHADELSYYVMVSASAEYVARDFSIDGGVFHHFDQTCSRKPWQAEAQIGVGAVYHGIDYYMGAVIHSRTYRTQEHNSCYGTFSITWHW